MIPLPLTFQRSIEYSRVSNNRTAQLLHNGKLDFIWLANEGQFDVVELMVNDKTFSINLNAGHVNGMTP